MRDLAHRILSKHVVRMTDVLVLSHELVAACARPLCWPSRWPLCWPLGRFGCGPHFGVGHSFVLGAHRDLHRFPRPHLASPPPRCWGRNSADDPAVQGPVIQQFQLNVLLTPTTVATLLQAGADAAGANGLFNAYLFATQGLDLAIPSQREHQNKKTCPSSPLRADFTQDTCDSLPVFCPSSNLASWVSSESKSEAVCVTVRCQDRVASACPTRVVVDESVGGPAKEVPNLLVLLIDPISRPLFQKALRKTKQLLDQMGFISCGNYTAVGENSGPNLAALCAGRALPSRRDGHGMSSGVQGTQLSKRRMDAWEIPTSSKASAPTRRTEMPCSTCSATTLLDRTALQVIQRPSTWPGIRRSSSTRTPAGSANGPHLLPSSTITKTRTCWRQRWTMSSETSFLTWTWHTAPRLTRRWSFSCLIMGCTMVPSSKRRRGAGSVQAPCFSWSLPRHCNGRRWLPTRVSGRRLAMCTPPFGVFFLAVRHTSDHPCFCHCRRIRRDAAVRPGCPIASANCGTAHTLPNHPSKWPCLPRCCRSLPTFRGVAGEVNPPARRLVVLGASSPFLLVVSARQATNPGILVEHASVSSLPLEFFALVDCWGADLRACTRKSQWTSHCAWRVPEGRVCLSSSSIPFPSHMQIASTQNESTAGEIPTTERRGREFQCASGLCAADFARFSTTGRNSIPNKVSALSACIPVGALPLCDMGPDSVCTDVRRLEHGLRWRATQRNISFWCSPEVDGHRVDASPWLFDVAKRLGFVSAFGQEFCFEGSPWVVQNNVFHLEADFMLHRALCRLAERFLARNNRSSFWPERKDPELFKFSTLKDSHGACIDGHSGPAKAHILLDPIEQMWDRYRNQPKFAFLNSAAAHLYSESWEETIGTAEAFDDSLRQFLSDFFTREEMGDTIVAVRSDHGLQDGPMLEEYSTKVEVFRPFTEVVVPEHFRGLSLEALWKNQARLVSGYDLYRTLTTAMIAGGTDTGAALPSWAVDLFAEEVPTTRSSWEATLPQANCRRLGLEAHSCNSKVRWHYQECCDRAMRWGPQPLSPRMLAGALCSTWS